LKIAARTVEALIRAALKGSPGSDDGVSSYFKCHVQTAEPKRDKLEAFNEALKDAHSDLKGDAVTKKAVSKKAGKADEAPTEKADKAEKPADVPASETPEGAAAEAEAAEGTEKSGS
jgi:small subunit ribosomal protein S16